MKKEGYTFEQIEKTNDFRVIIETSLAVMVIDEIGNSLDGAYITISAG